MNFEELKALDEQYVIQTYGRNPIAIDHGQGATLYDLAGKEYIDFSAGIGVNSVGTANPKWVAAVTEQAGKLGHISNLYYTQPYAKLAEKLCTRAGMAAAFFGNSGAEANEGIIKVARKYSYDKYGEGRGTVITLNRSFHGRTITTLAATGQQVFHQYFFPFPEGFRYADPNLDSVQAVAGHDVCAVLLELIQGEGGVLPMEQEFVTGLAKLCQERDWLLLVDEVQTGVGRTGSLFCYQQYGVQPDACSFAKGIAGGLPMGGFLVSEKCRNVLGAGQHGSTFGGNPVSAAAGCAVLDILDDETIEKVKGKGAYIRENVENMNLKCLGKTRGMGLMIGVDVAEGYSNKELCAKLNVAGLLSLTAGAGLRFLPPLTITKDEMDKGLAILRGTLENL
jgi:acetylornithine/N-succinyldiaminopimelate aminotransferase